MNSCFHKCDRERGYILLVLLLSVSLLSIGLMGMMAGIETQIKRDREEELIHRGVEYSRAVRSYVKKFGHYPTSVEALESPTSGRFLRKRYKDPITGKDFKLLYYGDLETFNAGAPIGSSVGNALKPAAAVAQASAAPSPSAVPPNEATTGQKLESNNPSGTSPPDSNDAIAQILAQQPVAADSPPQEQTESSEDTGGRAIIGVTSYSKSKSIRVFNKKDHYNQWQFVYDPSTDSGLITGPNQPLLKGAANVQPLQSGPSSAQDSGTQK
jgi:type II secretory pathway pseudopilin PulG